MLRVAAAICEAEGRPRMAELYTQFGGDVHVRHRRHDIVDHYDEGFPDYLRSIGLADQYLAAANDEKWDDVLQAETDEALSRTGKGPRRTPIIFFTRRDHDVPSSTGYQRVPRGDEALRLWDAVWEVATFPGLSELKRSLREKPQLADSLDEVASPSRG